MNVLRHLKPESSDTREETVHDSDRIWLEVPSDLQTLFTKTIASEHDWRMARTRMFCTLPIYI